VRKQPGTQYNLESEKAKWRRVEEESGLGPDNRSALLSGVVGFDFLAELPKKT